MKQVALTKAVKTVAKIYALFVALCAGYAVLLKVATPNDKKKFDETINNAIDDTMNVLRLKKRPTISTNVDGNDSFVMAAGGTINYKGGFFGTGTIVKTECNYILKINEKALKRQLNSYYQAFGNKQAVYDGLYLTVCHELRHMWQYESQWYVGKEYNPLKETTQRMLEGHGTLEEEADANKFATEMATAKGIRELGEYLDLLQRTAGVMFVDKDTVKELREKRTEVAKKYNKVLYIIYKLL